MNPFQKIDEELQYLAIEFCQQPIDSRLTEIISGRIKKIIEGVKGKCRVQGVEEGVANFLDDFKLDLQDGSFNVRFKNISYPHWFILINTKV